MKVSKRSDHTWRRFYFRTFAAQLHAVGFLGLSIGAASLLPLAKSSGIEHYYACLSFIVTGALLFLVSASYHFMSDGFESCDETHLFFENLDHFCIYLFIAGTYTPFLMNAVAAPWKMPLLIGVWAIAGLGITYTWLKPRLPLLLQHRMVYTGLFLIMGWVLLIRSGEIVATLSWRTLSFLLASLVFYSVGAVIYAVRRPRLFVGTFGYHELWHTLVLLGATSHYFMIYSFYGSPAFFS